VEVDIKMLEHPVSSRSLSLSGPDFLVVIYKRFLSAPWGYLFHSFSSTSLDNTGQCGDARRL
jgi:hypothetical protein